jgi:hypothetical protein
MSERLTIDEHTRVTIGENNYGKSAALEHLTAALTESVELFKREEKRTRRAASSVVAVPKWVEDLLFWCRERGIDTDKKIAAWLGVSRETVWGWKIGRAPQPKNITTIIEKTEGQINPRRRGGRRLRGREMDLRDHGRS